MDIFAPAYKRFTYKDPSWDTGAFWRFRTDMSDVDDDVASDLIQESITSQYTQDEFAEAQKNGESISDFLKRKIDRRLFVNGKRAFLVSKSVAWSCIVPADFQDDTKPQIGEDEDGEPVYPLHELAGKLAPIDPYWVGLIHPDVIDRAYEALKEKIVGRTPAQEKEFPEGDRRLDGPDGEGSGAEEVSEAAEA